MIPQTVWNADIFFSTYSNKPFTLQTCPFSNEFVKRIFVLQITYSNCFVFIEVWHHSTTILNNPVLNTIWNILKISREYLSWVCNLLMQFQLHVYFTMWASNLAIVALKSDAVGRQEFKVSFKLVQKFSKTVLIVDFDKVGDFYYLNILIYSIRASDRFIQSIFFRIFRFIGAFIRGNGCGISWSTVTCSWDSWPRT